MMARKSVTTFLRSPALTVWLLGLFFIYYLTVAVWSSEAFGSFVERVSDSMIFRAGYLLFLSNVSLVFFFSLKAFRRDKIGLVMRVPLYVGIVIVLFSFFFSLNTRKMQWLRPLGAGDEIRIPWEPAAYHIVSVDSALKKKALRTDETRIFDYEPGVTVQDATGALHHFGAYPPRRIGSTFFHVLQFGIGPGVEVQRGGKTVWQGYVALRLTPFGVVDVFEVPSLPYKFYLSIVPNRFIKRGRETAKDYDLEHPRYSIEIVRGDSSVLREETDTGVIFDGNMSLRFSPPMDWIIIEAVSDGFLVLLAIGIILILVGLLLYPFSLIFRKTHD